MTVEMKLKKVLFKRLDGDLTAEFIIDSDGKHGFDSEFVKAQDSKSLRFRNKDFAKFESGDYFIVDYRLALTGTVFTFNYRKHNGDIREFLDSIGAAAEPRTADPKFEEPREWFGFTDKIVDGFWISQEAGMAFMTAKLLTEAHPNRPVKILIKGPSGYGKTSISRLFANATGLSFYRMNCASIRDPEEWFGTREAVEGTTIFRPSLFIKRVIEGNTLVVLDEYNRLEPWLHNTLYPLLDDDAATTIYGEEYRVGQNVIFVATVNEGAEYTGTFELDAANANRFDIVIEMGELPRDREVAVIAERSGLSSSEAAYIIDAARSIRQIDPKICSMRTTLQIASLVATGLTPYHAFVIGLLNRVDKNDPSGIRKSVMDIISARMATTKQFRTEIEPWI